MGITLDTANASDWLVGWLPGVVEKSKSISFGPQYLICLIYGTIVQIHVNPIAFPIAPSDVLLDGRCCRRILPAAKERQMTILLTCYTAILGC